MKIVQRTRPENAPVPPSEPPSRRGRAGHPVRLMGAAGLAVLILAGGWTWSSHRPSDPAAPPPRNTDVLSNETMFSSGVRPLVVKAATPLAAAERAHAVLQVEAIVPMDTQGAEGETRWRVMDGDSVLMEYADFYELYHRCDGPSDLAVRYIVVNEYGQTLSEKRGYLRVE